ncbi:hypothetical protein P1P75_40320 [Streptomyces sp. ID05-39B]|uniref:hypothetical protein n=1 Tax=Streptomyces sp. ID05-39B TaxID=3028664 RepID=UPI0029A2A970|nr:hypothetical protein [Streptomyces sp. ID05-39B]MDX3532477.1 hypothetical protein [Streptomyces sp. ID05-39B]
MSITATETTPTPNGDTSYNAGYTDGELAAISKLPARRAHAIASMADQYDPLYAQGYADGYLAEIQRAHAYAEKNRAA